jgi:hypothetical protein
MMSWLTKTLGLDKLTKSGIVKDVFDPKDALGKLALGILFNEVRGRVVGSIKEVVLQGPEATRRALVLPDRDVEKICNSLRINDPTARKEVDAAFEAFAKSGADIVAVLQKHTIINHLSR